MKSVRGQFLGIGANVYTHNYLDRTRAKPTLGLFSCLHLEHNSPVNSRVKLGGREATNKSAFDSTLAGYSVQCLSLSVWEMRLSS